MSITEQEAPSRSLAILKWAVVFCLVAACVVGNSIYSADFSPVLRALVVVPVSILAAFIAFTTPQGMVFWSLLKESKNEVRRVIWPSRPETTQTTLIVIVVVLIMSLILWVLDITLNYLLSFLIG